MNSSFRNKNMLVIIFEIIVIILAVIGITFATSQIIADRTTTRLEAGEYNLDYKGDLVVNATELEPISDSLINYDTKENVVRLEFSLRGVSTNKNQDKLIYDVMLSEMNIDCSLLSKYTKWNLYKNGELLSTGSLDSKFDGDVLSDNMRLTNIQESLPKNTDEYDNYVLLFWISESCDDIETCERIDQSNIINSKMSMKVFIALYSGAKKEIKRVPNYDTSCANKPELYDNMIPVMYKDGVWVVADKTNSSEDGKWYDYSEQKWANAIVVNGGNYSSVGEIIKTKDIVAHYVWIPRFRYKTWNVLEEVTDSYNAYDEGIEILFENGLNKISMENYENDKYLTHPVFSDNLRGFWISKYELSMEEEKVKFIPNVNSYRGDTVENYQNLNSMLVNDYDLGDKVESHMVNNLEWGATLYLSHSKYGVCNGDGCSSIGMNDTYVSGNNKQDTTTRNVYGVYDMAGASGEYVLGSYTIGSATSEVTLSDGSAWYNGLSINSGRDYMIRGGLDRGIFYYGDLNMSPVENSTRSVLVSK